MNKTRHPQLELSVLADVNSKQSAWIAATPVGESLPQLKITAVAGFHKPASADDQLIYNAISDNYFGVSSKQD